MKLCFSTLACPERSVDEIIAGASAWGMDGVELRTAGGTGEIWTLPELREAALADTRRRFGAAGVEAPVVAAGLSFTDPSPAARRAALGELERFAVIAAGLGSRYLRLFGGPLQPGQRFAAGLEAAVEGFRAAAELAAGYGLEVLLETHDDFSTSRRVLPLVEALDGVVGVVWDILHPCRFGEAAEDTFAALGPYIRHVHLKDAVLLPEHDFENVMPGEGVLPIPRLVELMERGGYDGWYCFEWERLWWPRLLAAEQAVPRYAAYMKDLLAGLGA